MIAVGPMVVQLKIAPEKGLIKTFDPMVVKLKIEPDEGTAV